MMLGGFSRIGTQAAAEALRRDFRDLEPVYPNTQTIGVLVATFDKKESSDHGILENYSWVFLKGGRKTIDTTRTKTTILKA